MKPAAVLVNLTVAGTQSGPAFLTVWPFNQAKPLAASLNWVAAGTQVANAIILPLCTGGGCTSDWSLYASSGTELIVDVMGYFAAPTGGFVTGSCPAGKAVRSVNPDGSVVCESTAGANAMYQPAMRPWVLDLTSLGADYCCYAGGFTDGTNGYFVPFGLGTYSGRLLRLNIDAFTTASAASVDIAAVDGAAVGFAGGFTDGRYGYLVPYVNLAGQHGRLARIDLHNFTSGGVVVLDLASVDPDLVGLMGGFTDGRYGYVFGAYPPLNGKVARFDLAAFNASGVTVLDLAAINPVLKGFAGGFQDGRYGYLVPRYSGVYHGNLVRIDLADFSVSGVTVLNVATVDASLAGFNGGFTDGRYAWLTPGLGNKAARIDLANFTSAGVRAVDFATIDPALSAFSGGFSTGKYGVMVPYISGVPESKHKVVRIQLQEGAGTQ